MDDLTDHLRIRMLIEDWAVARDSDDWKLLRACWHPNSVMVASWFQGPTAEFIARSQAAFAARAICTI